MALTTSIGLDKALGTLVQEAWLRTRTALWREERSSSWEPQFQVAIVTRLFSPQTQYGRVVGRRESLAGHVRFFLPPSGLGLWPRQPLSSHLGMEPKPSSHPPADPGHSCRVRPEALLDRGSWRGDCSRLGSDSTPYFVLFPFLLIRIHSLFCLTFVFIWTLRSQSPLV